MLAAIPHALRGLRGENEAYAGADAPADVFETIAYAVTYSRDAVRPLAGYCSTSRAFFWEGYVPYAWGNIGRHLITPPVNLPFNDAGRDGLAVIEAQRRLEFLPEHPVCHIGGFAELVTITPFGVKQRKLKEWADRVGGTSQRRSTRLSTYFQPPWVVKFSSGGESMAWKLILAAAFSMLLSIQAFAATLIVENGVLKGATGVNVAGSLYDVLFKDGSCTALYSGCDQSTDFIFKTSAEAAAATSALLAQVFLDTPAGSFDTRPELTFGCAGSTNFCDILTPYAPAATGFVSYSYARNVPGTDSTAGGSNLQRSNDFSNVQSATFAVWTVSSVPEPSTWLMMILGFGIAGQSLRRSREQRFTPALATA